MKPKIFIDGEHGTTGLQIRTRMAGRSDVELLSIPEAERRNAQLREDLLNSADVAILCLPDDAAKEAVAKVLGAPAGMNWQDCWIGLDENGPTVQVKGTVLTVAEAKGVKRWHLSISHDGGIATATVLAEG